MKDILIHPENMRVSKLFKPDNTLAWMYLAELDWPWEALSYISEYITKLGAALDKSEYGSRQGNIWIHKTATISPTAFIGPGVIIGARTEVRHCAYIRGPALVGDDAIVGNSTELKNSILFNGAQVPHFNYVGDSILGHRSHMGAGAITSNVKSDSSLVSVACGKERVASGLKKFGAILGDNVEIGCNSVLNPGTVIGRLTTVYPLSMVRGFIPAESIYKEKGEVVEKH